MGRKNHYWDADGCRHCGMTQRTDYFSANGRVYAVMQWATPDGRLLAVRPVVEFGAPKTAPPLEGAFPGVPVSGMPECPKSREAWSQTRPQVAGDELASDANAKRSD